MCGRTTVLCVAPSGEMRERVVRAFAKEYPAVSVDTTPTIATARDVLSADDVDCVVSIAESPNRTDESNDEAHFRFLAGVRARLTVPCVLYTSATSPSLVRRAHDADVEYVRATGEGQTYVLTRRVASLVSADSDACRSSAGPTRDRTSTASTPSTSSATSTDGGTIDEQSLASRMSAYETLADGVFVVDDDERYTAMNDAFLELTGHSRDDLVGTSAHETLDAFDSSVDSTIGIDAPGERVAADTLLGSLPVGGGSVPVEARTSLVRLDDGSPGTVYVIRDISGWMRAHDELRQYETMLESVRDGVYAIDHDGRYLATNRAYESMLDAEPGSLIGRPAAEVIGTEVYEEAVRHAKLLESSDEEIATFRYEQPTLSGETFPAEVRFSQLPLGDGSSGRVGVIRDISGRKQLEEELDAILGRITDAFFALDRDWKFTYVNERAEELITKTADELLGSSIWEQYPGAVGTDFEREYQRAMTEQVSVSFESFFGPLDTLFQVHAYPSESGLSVYFRDVTHQHNREERLSGLTTRMQALLDTETWADVCSVGMSTARDVLSLPNVVLALYDNRSGLLEPVADSGQAVEQLDRCLFSNDGDDLAWRVFVEGEPRIYDDLWSETLDGVGTVDRTDSDSDRTRMRSAMLLPLGEHGVFITASPVADCFSETDVSLIDILGACIQSALDRTDREHELRDRTEELEEKNEALERVYHINSVIREITQVITQASTREEVDQAVCERLAASEPYRFAWIGDRNPISNTIEPRASAGVERGYLDAIDMSIDADDSLGQGPCGQAIRSRTPQVQNDIHSAPSFEPWREAALTRGYRSCVSVPLLYAETFYGVLNLYAGRPNVFHEMEQSVLRELGGIIGHAYNALERKQALVSEQSLELEFEVGPPVDGRLSFVTDLDCEFELEHVVQRGDGLFHLFFTVRETDAEAVLEALADRPDIDHVTLIAERGEELFFEYGILDAALLDRGGRFASMQLTSDGGSVVVVVAPDADVRSFVEMFERVFEDVQLVARHERDTPVKTTNEFRTEFESRLTPRQEEVLQTAFFAGFFEWPRESTGEDVADMLGVSQPTIHRHLRNSERKLFSLLFESP